MKNEKILKIKNEIVHMFEHTNYLENSICERLEKPLLLSSICIKTIEKIVSLTFEEQTLLISLLKEENFERGTFISAFYYSIYARKENFEKLFYQYNKELYNDGKKLYGDVFVNGNPIFDAETFWLFISHEDFLIEYDNITLSEMFGSIVAYALPKKIKTNIQYFLLNFIKEFEKELVVTIPIQILEEVFEECEFEIYNAKKVLIPGTIFINELTNNINVYIGTTNENLVLARVFLDVDMSILKNQEIFNIVPF